MNPPDKALAGVVAGEAAVLGAVVLLLNRVRRPVREVQRYCDDIATGATGIVRHTDAGPPLLRLSAAVRALRTLVVGER